MEKSVEQFKGIHPGFILDRELKKRALKPSPFASSLGTHRQIISAIIHGKRGLSIQLALSIDKALGFEEGTFALLQTYYDINQLKNQTNTAKPNLKNIRKVLFWDTDIDKINWHKQYKAVIKRVFERGNQLEQEEIKRFYGEKKIEEVLS